ncbi:MAG: right-handed parallel beta-helix repeat-containing protein [Mangrovibacterium sp.]
MKTITRKSKTYPGMCVLILTVLMSCTQQKPIKFFVSTDGDDANPGTEAAPFKTLEKAKESVRSQLPEAPGKPVEVNIKGGIYYLEKPVVFSSEDSGTENAQVVYKAAKGENPVFTGSREVKNWKLLDDTEKLKLLPPEAPGKIYVTDLKASGINDVGDPTQIGKRPELFCDGKMQTLARWPNTGFVHAGLAKGKTEHAPTYIEKHGTIEGVFEYLETRQNRWTEESDARLGGYWYWDWSDEFQKVEKIDARSKTVYLSEPYHYYGYRDSLRYFGLNLFCEIDQPKEWYLDRTSGLLYWFPPQGINPNQANVTFSVFSGPFMVEMKNCSNITIEGLTFQEGRGSAIYIGEGKNCLLSGCRIDRFGKDGIHIDGGEGHGVSGCLLQNFGCRGIQIKGGDRKTLTPANHSVENTIVEHFSLYKRTYEPAVYLDGCGIRISNNRFAYSSSSAMRLEGNDFTIEYNEISRVVNESDDQGGIDIYNNLSYRGIVIRYNRWSDIKGGTRHGAAGVRLDDMISGVAIFGNVFERCGALHFGGVQINGGKDNLVENNLFYDCDAAVSFTKWREEFWMKNLESPGMKSKIYEEVDIRSDLYQNKYPGLKNLRSGINVNTVKNNLLVDCDKLFKGGDGTEISENNSIAAPHGKTVEDFCSSDVLKNYGMQPIPYSEIGPKNNKWIKTN